MMQKRVLFNPAWLQWLQWLQMIALLHLSIPSSERYVQLPNHN